MLQLNFVALLNLICVQVILQNLIVCTKTDPKRVLSTAYEDVRTGKRVRGKALEKQAITSDSKCALACNVNIRCRFFTVCIDDGLCYMYREDVFSTEKGDDILRNYSNCKYYGMKRDSVPFCSKDGNFVGVQQNRNIKCRNGFKDIDREWGPWITVVDIDSETKFKKILRREMIVNAAHGGLAGKSEIEKTVSWLRFEKQMMAWHEAKHNCNNLDGKLFSNLTEGTEQLNFIARKMDNESFWLGIFTEDRQTWKNVDGVKVDNNLLQWGESPPDKSGRNEYYVGVIVSDITSQPGLNDFAESAMLGSVCDILPSTK